MCSSFKAQISLLALQYVVDYVQDLILFALPGGRHARTRTRTLESS